MHHLTLCCHKHCLSVSLQVATTTKFEALKSSGTARQLSQSHLTMTGVNRMPGTGSLPKGSTWPINGCEMLLSLRSLSGSPSRLDSKPCRTRFVKPITRTALRAEWTPQINLEETLSGCAVQLVHCRVMLCSSTGPVVSCFAAAQALSCHALQQHRPCHAAPAHSAQCSICSRVKMSLGPHINFGSKYRGHDCLHSLAGCQEHIAT